ncbi:MAG: energy transducer TonB [Methylococcales bacterium]
MNHLFSDNDRVIHWPMLKRFQTLVLFRPRNPHSQLSPRIGQSIKALWSSLMGEERPRPMTLLLTLLVLAVHLWVVQKLLTPLEPLTLAKPLMMEVSLMAAAAPQQSETVTKPVKEPKPEPLKPKPPKPIKQKLKPVVRKAVEVPKKAVIKTVKMPAPTEPQETVSEAPPAPPAPVKAAAPKVATAPNKAEVFTEANFRANYGYNPKPVYPSIARREHWEGKVTLRVQVGADGSSDTVGVHHSSGHEELDDAAVEAVKKWRFIPAKRGETPVSSSVLVPIIFNLHN